MRRPPLPRRLMAIVCLLGLAAAPVLARPGLVQRFDGTTVRGDVQEVGTRLIVVLKGGGSVELDRTGVESIVYADSAQDEFTQRLAALGQRDIRGRLDLASWAIEQKEYDLAMDALDGVREIDPRNPRAQSLMRSVQMQRQQTVASPLAQSPAARLNPPPARPAVATRPTTRPATRPTTAPATMAAAAVPIRMVTPREVNRIRQMEWGSNDKTVRVRIDQNTRNQYTEQANIPAAQFSRMTVIEQARRIIEDGSPALRDQVGIVNDPAPLLEYRRQIQRVILPGCATANCHSGPDAGRFKLHVPGDQDVATYTNFLILQNHEVPLKTGGTALLIDHTRPQDSLLLQYGLPQDVAQLAHPKATNFRPVYKGATDPRYKEVERWISQSLSTVKPDYQVDLTRPLENAPPAGAPTPLPAPPAPGAAPPVRK